jgi:SAM-dependent methyltransferase
MRQLSDADDDAAEARIEEVRRLVDPRDDGFGEAVDLVELDVVDLYAAWSATYDEASRPVRVIEEPVVWALLERLPTGRALDAACGTGRHARWLVELGHEVLGVDASPEMLERARAAVPGARFEAGDLCALPVDTASVDVAVCALALDHLPDLVPPLAELARVVRRGGSVVISDVHPLVSFLGGVAHVQLGDGTRGFARNHCHLHGQYLDAFAEVGLEVRACLEPRYDVEALGLKRTAMRCIPEATTAAYLGMPAAVIWDLARR